MPNYVRDVDPSRPVMMYCTGGIRCDVYSAYLKQKGWVPAACICGLLGYWSLLGVFLCAADGFDVCLGHGSLF